MDNDVRERACGCGWAVPTVMTTNSMDALREKAHEQDRNEIIAAIMLYLTAIVPIAIVATKDFIRTVRQYV